MRLNASRVAGRTPSTAGEDARRYIAAGKPVFLRDYTRTTSLGAFALALFLGVACAGAADEPKPLTRAHAHNDYLHERPLLDALDRGFCSFEADIFLVNSNLLVAHDLARTSPERTLQKLYLDPLRERIKRNGGRVYPGGPPVWLLIDIKSNPEATYAVLRDVLKSYADILTRFEGGQITTNAVTVVISGNRPRATIIDEKLRYAALDGLLSDLDGAEPASLIPWICENWQSHFQWRGQGELSADEKEKLRDYVTRTHRTGRLLRFWNAPDNEATWRLLYDAGVDLLNSDALAGMQTFLGSRSR